MADKSVGMVFVLFLVLLLSFKDLLFINKDVDSQSTAKTNTQGDLNQPVNLDVDGEYTSHSAYHQNGEDDDHLFHNHHDQDENDLASKMSQEEAYKTGAVDFVKKIPPLKMRSNVQTIKFLYCFSCGYRNAFEQYSQMIRARYPELKIVGENYAPQSFKVYMAQFLSGFKMIVIGLILFGQNPFTYFNIATPALFTWALENKLYATLMTFFLSNAIETHLITTGAFEIFMNGIQIWSKIQSDRFPHEKELLQILDMNFNFESEKNAAFGAGSSAGKF